MTNSANVATEALARQALEEARIARANSEEALRLAKAAAQRVQVAEETLNTSEQYILDVVYGKFKDFFHDALMRYLDYNRPDYDKTLRDWAFNKFTAWSK